MASDMSDSVFKGIGTHIGDLLNWGIAKQRPKTIEAADALTRKLIGRWVGVTLAVSWVPGSTFVLMGMDYKLYHDVARIYGVKSFNIDAVQASLLATLTGRGASEALSFIPGVGWVVKAGIAGVVTQVTGDVIMDYMRERSPLNK